MFCPNGGACTAITSISTEQLNAFPKPVMGDRGNRIDLFKEKFSLNALSKSLIGDLGTGIDVYKGNS